jgi:hypothetical protein
LPDLARLLVISIFRGPNNRQQISQLDHPLDTVMPHKERHIFLMTR